MKQRAATLIHNLFSFKGRIRRSDYWIGMIIIFIGMVAVASVLAGIWKVDLADRYDLRASAIQAGVVLLFMWPNLAVSVKRLHDRDQSGWWILLSFLPVIGNVWTLVNLGILRGTPGGNRYGAEPARAQLTLIERNAAAA
jgi:uncharacterized membrane protein YhaH (DUF805 family)